MPFVTICALLLSSRGRNSINPPEPTHSVPGLEGGRRLRSSEGDRKADLLQLTSHLQQRSRLALGTVLEESPLGVPEDASRWPRRRQDSSASRSVPKVELRFRTRARSHRARAHATWQRLPNTGRPRACSRQRRVGNSRLAPLHLGLRKYEPCPGSFPRSN